MARKTNTATTLKRLVRRAMTATDTIDLNELERRAKALTALAKAEQSVLDLVQQQMAMEGTDERLDATGEQQLREKLLRRLDALAQEWNEKGVPEFARSE